MLDKELQKNQVSPVTPSGQSYPNTTARPGAGGNIATEAV
jgi:hypothetical protein